MVLNNNLKSTSEILFLIIYSFI